jgi:RNA polymerase sigma factor for flagellar operon FliA
VNLGQTSYVQDGAVLEERNDLAMRELPQVYYLATRMSEKLPRHVELQDLVQAGVIGLLEACRTYDPDKDAQFSTFAKFRIRGAILDSLRRLDWGSRSMRRKSREIGAAKSALEGKLGRQPSEEEIAAELGMSLPDLHAAMAQIDGLYLVGQSAQSQFEDGEVYDVIESAPAPADENPFEIFAEGERKEHLAKAIAELSDREQLILSLYYKEELTMREVAEVVGIAVSRVSQIHTAVLKKLRAQLEKRTPSVEPKTSERHLRRPARVSSVRSSYECIA